MDIPSITYNIVWPVLYAGLIFFIISIHRQKYLYEKSHLIILFWLGIILNLSWIITYFQYNNYIASVIILTFLILTSILTLSFIPFRKDAIMKVNFFIYLLYSGWLVFAMTLLISNESTPTVSATESPNAVAPNAVITNAVAPNAVITNAVAPNAIVSATDSPNVIVPSTDAPVTEAPTILNPTVTPTVTPNVTPQTTEAPVLTQKILHWVNNCRQCDDEGLNINFCQKANENEVNSNEFDSYTHGENLSVWGCDKVDYPTTPIIRFGNSASVYVVENVYN